MFRNLMAILFVLTALVCLGGASSAVMADEALDKAFDALKTYDWGQDRAVLQPIDAAVAASHKDAAARTALEKRLAEILGTNAPRAAKDAACRHLSLVGSAASVPKLAPLLDDEKLSHMARYALERIPDAEAVEALRDALKGAQGRLKVGIINSLGVRRDAKSVTALTALLENSDKEIASAAAGALGSIGTPEAAKALTAFQAKAPKELQLAAADACLACAERLLDDGKKLEAVAIYKPLAKQDQLPHVRVAATRGLLAAMK